MSAWWVRTTVPARTVASGAPHRAMRPILDGDRVDRRTPKRRRSAW